MVESELIKSFNKKQKFMIISVVAFLCTLIAATYAWIAHDFLGNSNTMSLTSISFSIDFTDDSVVSFADIAPGESVTKVFKVGNITEEDLAFNIICEDVINNFENRNYFSYYVVNQTTGEVVVTQRYLPTNDIMISSNLVIPANESYTYSLTATYVNDPLNDQSNNQNLYFQGKIGINTEELVAGSQVDIMRRTNIFVDNIMSDTLPPISEYTIDTSRTYCTDGSSIGLVDGDLEISNLTNKTNCEIHVLTNGTSLVEKTVNDKYNLLVINYNDDSHIDSLLYLKENETFTLVPPNVNGYVFFGWDIVSNDSVLNNNTLTMGTNYTYVEANMVAGHYNKTTQTCTQGAPSSYTRSYKICDRTTPTFTKVSKVCSNRVESFKQVNSRCGCSCTSSTETGCTYWSCSWTQTSTKWPTGSCDSWGNTCLSGSRSSSLYNGNTKAECSSQGYSYSFGSPVTTTSTTCVQSLIACDSSTYPSGTHVACTPNYSYALNSTVSTDTQVSCGESSFTCNASTYQTQYTTNCEPLTYDYGFIPTTSQTNVCSTTDTFTCNSSTNNNTYVSACDFVAE